MAKTFQKSEPPLLSILLVTYNHIKYFEEAIKSILSQKTSYPYEIIIIDDCSTDGTSELAAKYQKQYPDIIKYYRSKQNIGKARQAIFQLRPDIRGDYWAILEGDDFWTDNEKLEKQLSFLECNPDYIAATSAYYIYDQEKETKDFHIAGLEQWDVRDMVAGEYALYCHTSTYIWRNIFKNKTPDGFFWPNELKEKHTLGDVCLSFFMAKDGGKIKCLPEAMSCYRVTNDGTWTSLSQQDQDDHNNALNEKIFRITGLKPTLHEDKSHQFKGFFKTRILWLYRLCTKWKQR